MTSQIHKQALARLAETEPDLHTNLFHLRVAYALSLRAGDELHTPASAEKHAAWKAFDPARARRLLADGRQRMGVRMLAEDDDEPQEWTEADAFAQAHETLRPGMRHPNAFSIDLDARVVTIHHIVVTNDVRPQHYINVWDSLDGECWFLRLLVHSHHGGLLGKYEDEDFANIHFEVLSEDVARQRGEATR